MEEKNNQANIESGNKEIKTFEDLYLYKLARELKNKVYTLTKKLPEEEKFNLIGQMRRAALSMTNNLAEGYGRYHFQENIQYCRQCRGSIYELIDDFNDCFDKGYIDEVEQRGLKSEAYKLIKVLNNYIGSQQRQKEKHKIL